MWQVHHMLRMKVKSSSFAAAKEKKWGQKKKIFRENVML